MFEHQYQQTGFQSTAYVDFTDVVDAGFSFAFQPIVSMDSLQIIGHEALVRGLDGASAASVISAIAPDNQYGFDQACRIRALEMAARLSVDGNIHLNCSAIDPDNLPLSIEATRECVERLGIAPARVVLEFGNLERLGNPRQLDATRAQVESAGFRVLADNIGTQEVGLKRLVVFKPEYAKLDRSLIRGITDSPRRQAIVHGLVATCRALGIKLIAGGIESESERSWLHEAGVRIAQGFLFARPAFEQAQTSIEAACAA